MYGGIERTQDALAERIRLIMTGVDFTAPRWFSLRRTFSLHYDPGTAMQGTPIKELS